MRADSLGEPSIGPLKPPHLAAGLGSLGDFDVRLGNLLGLYGAAPESPRRAEAVAGPTEPMTTLARHVLLVDGYHDNSKQPLTPANSRTDDRLEVCARQALGLLELGLSHVATAIAWLKQPSAGAAPSSEGPQAQALTDRLIRGRHDRSSSTVPESTARPHAAGSPRGWRAPPRSRRVLAPDDAFGRDVTTAPHRHRDARGSRPASAATNRLSATPDVLDFTLLGGFSLSRGSRQVADAAWDRRVARRLVRYLLIRRGNAVPEDLLLEAFWPANPHESARRSLKVAVSCARSVLDAPGSDSVIVVAERTLRLKLRAGDSVDVDRFDQAAQTALAAGDDRRKLLERAAALWGGEPLPEERYADWTAAWRDELTVRYAAVIHALVDACRNEGDHLAATHAARRLVELDPLDEGAHRKLITAYARSGRRAHALRQYLECHRALVDQLGVEPDRETKELQQRVLAGEAT